MVDIDCMSVTAVATAVGGQVRKVILKEVTSQLRPELEAMVAANDKALQGEYSPDSASAARRCAPRSPHSLSTGDPHCPSSLSPFSRAGTTG